MRRRKKSLAHAGVYLLLLLLTPFLCMAAAEVIKNPAELISEAALDSAEFQAGVKAVTKVTEEITVTSVSVQTEQSKPKTYTFRIITDDSFIKNNSTSLPSSHDEEAPIKPPVTDNSADSTPETPYKPGNTSGFVDIVTYGTMTGSAYIDLVPAGQIRNMTSIDNALLTETSEELPAFTLKRDGSPEILIYHTHATESFLPADFANTDSGDPSRFDTSFSFRSVDKSINMVAVGKAITEQLRTAGFGVIHDETLYDGESYNGSYELSRAGVKAILAENPGIKVVLDVHRDALVKSDTEIVAPTAVIDGKDSAQIMIVSNCDSESLKYPIPEYRENLKLASLFGKTAETRFPGLMRPILFDYRQYNQDLSPGALLIEVGGHGNTITQAVYAGELFGQGLAEALQEISQD
jgi:stage II sporulation protein P